MKRHAVERLRVVVLIMYIVTTTKIYSPIPGKYISDLCNHTDFLMHLKNKRTRHLYCNIQNIPNSQGNN